MSHDPTSERSASDDRGRDALRVALADLAATMPDDPYRIDDILAKAGRLRARRRARRATVLAVAGGATIGTLVVVRAGPTRVSTPPAGGEPTTVAAAPPPVCSAVLAELPPRATAPPGPPDTSKAADPGSTSAADAAKKAASVATDAANHAATGLRGVKSAGTIVSVTDTTITFTVVAAEPGQPAEITATIGPDAIFADGNHKLDGRPPLNAGDPVFFATTQADDGSYGLVYLQVHPLPPEARSAGTVDPGEKAANAADDSRYVKGSADVVSVQPDSVSLKITAGPLTGQVVTAATGPLTDYTAGGQACVDPQVSAGSKVDVLLVRGDDGSLTALSVDLVRD